LQIIDKISIFVLLNALNGIYYFDKKNTQKLFDMLTVPPQFITDAAGNKISVVLSIADYEALIEELEDFEDERLYNEAKKVDEPSIPIDEAFRIIEAKRAMK
jgi:hypothetical protein